MTELTRRAAFAGLVAATAGPALAQRRPVAPPLSAEDKALVDRATAYLQSLVQVKGRFRQTDARGRISEGDFYLKRPSKIRFAYDLPNDMLVVSNGNTVNIYSKRMGSFESYPLGATPLSLFLAKEIRLDRGVVISRVQRLADGFSITATDGKHEAEGSINLVFGGQPLALREWTVTDLQGGRTRVVLSGLQPVGALDNNLFVLRDPRPGPGVAKR